MQFWAEITLVINKLHSCYMVVQTCNHSKQVKSYLCTFLLPRLLMFTFGHFLLQKRKRRPVWCHITESTYANFNHTSITVIFSLTVIFSFVKLLIRFGVWDGNCVITFLEWTTIITKPVLILLLNSLFTNYVQKIQIQVIISMKCLISVHVIKYVYLNITKSLIKLNCAG